MCESPLIVELVSAPAPADALALFQDWPRAILFHSSAVRPSLGQYSFLSADPIVSHDVSVSDVLDSPNLGSGGSRTEAVFGPLRKDLSRLQSASIPTLPPFQGGLAGVISYEAGHLWERLPSTGPELTPAVSAGLYDWVLAWDHKENRAWVIVQQADGLRREAVAQRLEKIQSVLQTKPHAPRTTSLAALRTAPHPGSPFDRVRSLTSNFTSESYQAAVSRIIRYVYAGDIFQANLSQRFSASASLPPVELYRRLAAVNPAPFAGYYDGGTFQVISASPERFLRLSNSEVETRPIKGTRARRPGVEADLFTRDELRESEKDRAENVMIVDLLRNDLSRVCRAGSIRVPQLCAVETYETVQHLVSEVCGTLRPGVDFFDLLAATFPGGSITGAPKIRAMEIITELEQVPRGPYCGTMFYLGVGGQADSSILIRTFTQAAGRLYFPAGGGITAQSDPASEYEETLHKVEGLLRALE
jgi:para-aminobenzoate synthetase component 1